MKRRNIFIISTFGIIILFCILIGTGILNIHMYKYEFSNSISSSWNNSKSIGRIDNSDEEISFPTVPIIVVYKTKKVGDTISQNPVIIDISDKDFGTLWFPLVNKSDYHFSVTCKNVQTFQSDTAMGQYKVDGEINVSGHYQFIGLYSKKTMTNLVVDKVLNDIYNESKKNI